MTCEFLKNGECVVASELAGYPSQANDSACEVCLSGENPRGINRVTVSLAIGATGRAGDQDKMQELAKAHGVLLKGMRPDGKRKKGRKLKLNGWGAGSQLHQLLESMGINARPSCQCMKMAAEMDEKGIAWSRENADRAAEVMKREAKARGWPLADTALAKAAARRLVNVAIKRAEREAKKRGIDS